MPNKCFLKAWIDKWTKEAPLHSVSVGIKWDTACMMQKMENKCSKHANHLHHCVTGVHIHYLDLSSPESLEIGLAMPIWCKGKPEKRAESERILREELTPFNKSCTFNKRVIEKSYTRAVGIGLRVQTGECLCLPPESSSSEGASRTW